MIKDETLNIMLIGSIILLIAITIFCVHVSTREKAVCGGCNLCNGKIIEESTEAPANPQKHTFTAHYKRPTPAEIQFETEIAETGAENDAETAVALPVYKVGGVIIDEALQNYLFRMLQDLGHEEFYEFAICQIFQESRGDVMADNGKDKGLLQFREMYWNEYAEAEGLHTASVMDPVAQIYVYTRLMARRLDSGLMVQEAISRHYTSDFCEYDARYVADVLQWYETLERIN